MHVMDYPQVPGLYLFPGFFDSDQSTACVSGSIEYHTRLENELATTNETSQIPIPITTVESQNHNLDTQERFARIKLQEDGERVISCEYFPRYGEDGHALCYFRKTRNLPDFVRGQLIERMEQLAIERQFGTTNENPYSSDTKFDWRLTVNFYSDVQGLIAGFPFHVDIPANGIVTMILNVHRTALFQITNDLESVDIELPIGGLLVLSGESRYQWKHRVLPTESNETERDGIARVSIVLGFNVSA